MKHELPPLPTRPLPMFKDPTGGIYLYDGLTMDKQAFAYAQQVAEPLLTRIALLEAQLASGQEPVGERKASEVWIESESFKAKAPLKDGGVSNRFSFNCSGGCGECGVKVIEFVSYSKQGDEDERWVTIASEPQLISTCCGSPVEIYDDLIRDFCAAVEAVSYIPAPAQQPLSKSDAVDAARYRYCLQHGWPECRRQIHPTVEALHWGYEDGSQYPSPTAAIDAAAMLASKVVKP
jgi:hypothetical protein